MNMKGSVIFYPLLLILGSHMISHINAYIFRVNPMAAKLTLNSDGNTNGDYEKCCDKSVETTCKRSLPTSSSLCSTTEPITMNDLTDENIVKIVRMECSDDDVNVLVWRCLGYVYDKATDMWDSKDVFPKW